MGIELPTVLLVGPPGVSEKGGYYSVIRCAFSAHRMPTRLAEILDVKHIIERVVGLYFLIFKVHSVPQTLGVPLAVLIPP